MMNQPNQAGLLGESGQDSAGITPIGDALKKRRLNVKDKLDTKSEDEAQPHIPENQGGFS